jgi:UDPglucose--hexose-1-phosphate uridylyltransferase
MVEVRVDAETGDWSVIAPRRSSRPVDGVKLPSPCPFCPGNEHMTPPEVYREPAGPAWHQRVVPNLYAAVGDDAGRDAGAGRSGFYGGQARQSSTALPFTGRHEVVIESERHDWDLRRATPDEALAVFDTVRQRYRALAAHAPAAISVFRNYGERAGASLHHPHSQMVALDHLPPRLAARWQQAREHFERTGRRLHDDLAQAERDNAGRVVADEDGVLVYQPFAAAVPHQTVLLPGDDGLAPLATLLPRVLTALAEVLDDPAYNLVLHTGPPVDGGWYRWHLSIHPRVTTPGGLEIDTGVVVNPTAPEDTAAALRGALR